MAFVIAKLFLLSVVSMDLGMMYDGYNSYDYSGSSSIRDVQLVCLDDKFQIRFETDNAAAAQNGKVFVKGRSSDNSCSAPLVPNASIQMLNVTLSTCGMERSGLRGSSGAQFTLIVIVTFHPYFVTKSDRAFRLTCVYGHTGVLGVTQLNGNLDVSMLPTTSVERHFGTPDCSYSLHSGNEFGPIVRYAQIGVTVVHVWTCRNLPADNFLFIHDCFVVSERGINVQIIDTNGCSKDRIAMSNMNYTSNSQVIGTHMAYHFADEMSLHYKCEISICSRNPQTCKVASIPPNCPTFDQNSVNNYAAPPGIVPSANSGFYRDFQSPQQFYPTPRRYGRQKRSPIEPEWSFDVNTEPIAVLNLTRTNSLSSFDFGGKTNITENKTNEKSVCFTSTSLAVSLSCFTFLLAFTIILFLILMVKFRGVAKPEK